MTERLLIDLTPGRRVSVGMWPDGDFPGGTAEESFELVWPLDGEALEELRWYLEDYLQAPFGVYESRGPAVAAKLPAWGKAVFEAVFRAANRTGYL